MISRRIFSSVGSRVRFPIGDRSLLTDPGSSLRQHGLKAGIVEHRNNFFDLAPLNPADAHARKSDLPAGRLNAIEYALVDTDKCPENTDAAGCWETPG